MPDEIEFKYSRTDDHVPSAAEVRAALDGTGLEVDGPRLVRQKDRYYDDARLSLSRAGLALRRRMAEGRLLATLKTRGDVAGALHRREEIELPVPQEGGIGPAALWPAPILERVSRACAPSGLKPVLEIETERVRFALLRDGGARALLLFDDVRARFPGSGREVAFAEMELEAAGGADADELRGAAERLEPLFAATPSNVTKLERARALLMAGIGLE